MITCPTARPIKALVGRAFCYSISKIEPPVKSIPKSRPKIKTEAMEARTKSPEMVKNIFRYLIINILFFESLTEQKHRPRLFMFRRNRQKNRSSHDDGRKHTSENSDNQSEGKTFNQAGTKPKKNN